MQADATLGHWLQRLEGMQPDKMELGLARINRVASAAQLHAPAFPVITIAGTNGKGSTAAYVANLLHSAGLSVGVYTSPHFVEFNERISIDAVRIDNHSLCNAFEFIEQHRRDIELTYFEFTTLAGMYHFIHNKVDVAVMEVGLGGRLDAVNAWHSEVACITSIGLDHVDWLGSDRESIGLEKAGVARAGKPLVFGDTDMPASIADHANSVGAKLLRRGHDFLVEQAETQPYWKYSDPDGELDNLPLPVIPGEWPIGNAATAICVCGQFLGKLPSHEHISRALREVTIAGRMQHVEYKGVTVVLDVAHNREAAALLGRYLVQNPVSGRTTAVFACMRDKDSVAIVASVAATVDNWHLATIDYGRAMEAQSLEKVIKKALAGQPAAAAEKNEPQTTVFASVIRAFEAAVAQSVYGDRVVVFGSFYTVAPVLELIIPEQADECGVAGS